VVTGTVTDTTPHEQDLSAIGALGFSRAEELEEVGLPEIAYTYYGGGVNLF
jgi:hypothetical protein